MLNTKRPAKRFTLFRSKYNMEHVRLDCKCIVFNLSAKSAVQSAVRVNVTDVPVKAKLVKAKKSELHA